jgi:hypothetical protein
MYLSRCGMLNIGFLGSELPGMAQRTRISSAQIRLIKNNFRIINGKIISIQ